MDDKDLLQFVDKLKELSKDGETVEFSKEEIIELLESYLEAIGNGKEFLMYKGFEFRIKDMGAFLLRLQRLAYHYK